MNDNIVHVFGGPQGGPQGGDEPPLEPVASCVQCLEHWLEMAKTGTLVGMAFVGLHNDYRVGYTLAGQVGGLAMLGAIKMVEQDLVDVNLEIQ